MQDWPSNPVIASDVVVAAPVEETVNWLLFPTVRSWEGEVVPMPTLPPINAAAGPVPFWTTWRAGPWTLLLAVIMDAAAVVAVSGL
jgi:hypothetical protein